MAGPLACRRMVHALILSSGPASVRLQLATFSVCDRPPVCLLAGFKA